jgi:YihY family inner membrane protein
VAIARTVQERQVTFLAAAVAYYAFVSLVPLALFGLALGQLVGEAWIDALLAQSEQLLAPSAVAVLDRSIADETARGGATVVGLLVFLWSGSRVFRGLTVAFTRVYGVKEHKPFLATVLDVAIVLLGIPVALAAAAILGVVLPRFAGIPGSKVLSAVALVFVLALVFFPMYYRLPNAAVTAREAVPGAFVAAVGWAALATTFSLYTTYIGDFQLYGVLGAALLLLTWLYLGGIIIVVGAIVNIVVAGTSTEDPHADDSETAEEGPESVPDLAELGREVRALREDLDEKTVSRSSLEAELKAYVRKRQRAGKATGWGPYLVLLYGTAMTLGAFYWLNGGWAILAMIVVWLSTLGLYVQLVVFGMGIKAASVPGRLLDRFRS